MKNRAYKFKIRCFPAILILVIIFLASSTPEDNLPSFGFLDVLIKSGGHFVGYFLLSLSFIRCLGKWTKKTALLVVIFTLIFALADEFHQSFIPGRHPDITDIMVDMAGSLLGVCMTRVNKLVKQVVFSGLRY